MIDTFISLGLPYIKEPSAQLDFTITKYIPAPILASSVTAVHSCGAVFLFDANGELLGAYNEVERIFEGVSHGSLERKTTGE